MPKRTYQPKRIKRIRKFGFMSRMKDRAGRVEVDLTRTPSGYRLVVEDDGVGLPVGGGDGFGLSLVRMLVGQLGGRIVFDSAPGGLRVEVVIERGPT